MTSWSPGELSSKIQELTSTLDYQLRIQAHRTIPNCHQPRRLRTQDTNITKQFDKDYETLFFDYLDKAIINNNIQLELYKAALTTLNPTDKDNDNDQTNPQPTKRYKRGNRGQKRKPTPIPTTPALTPPPPKSPRTGHFLSPGHPPQHNPP